MRGLPQGLYRYLSYPSQFFIDKSTQKNWKHNTILLSFVQNRRRFIFYPSFHCCFSISCMLPPPRASRRCTFWVVCHRGGVRLPSILLSSWNVFVKPNDQSQTCLSFGMTRRRRWAPFVRRMKSNSWQNVYTWKKTCSHYKQFVKQHKLIVK